MSILYINSDLILIIQQFYFNNNLLNDIILVMKIFLKKKHFKIYSSIICLKLITY